MILERYLPRWFLLESTIQQLIIRVPDTLRTLGKCTDSEDKELYNIIGWDVRFVGLLINYMGDGRCLTTGVPISLIMTL